MAAFLGVVPLGGTCWVYNGFGKIACRRREVLQVNMFGFLFLFFTVLGSVTLSVILAFEISIFNHSNL